MNQLVMSGCRAVGVDERRAIRAQRGLATFPEDYPETRAGEMDEKLRARDMRRDEGRRPKGKRPNYVTLSVPFPYRSRWTDSDHTKRDEEGGTNSNDTSTSAR